MPSIQAMDNGKEQGLECLGDLRMVKSLRYRSLKLARKVTVAGNTYKKKMDAPFYKPGTVSRWRETPAGKDQKLLGAVPIKNAKDGAVLGYVRRQQGAHTFCLPVLPVEGYTSVFWRLEGYLMTDRGCVAVVRRRVLFWFMLAITAVLAFFLSFHLLRYGFRDGLSMLWGTLLDLPRAIETGWFSFWHRVL